MKSLQDAIAAIEQASAAEVVVAVRKRGRVWLAQHAIVGAVAAIAVLVYIAYSKRAFARWELVAFPVATAFVAALLAEIPPIYRFLVPAHVRRHHVHDAARLVFLERNLHATKGRTGLLVFVALRERMVELVGDIAIERACQAKLDGWAAKLAAALPDPEALAKALEALAPELAAALPRQAGDVNELPDAVVDVRA